MSGESSSVVGTSSMCVCIRVHQCIHGACMCAYRHALARYIFKCLHTCACRVCASVLCVHMREHVCLRADTCMCACDFQCLLVPFVYAHVFCMQAFVCTHACVCMCFHVLIACIHTWVCVCARTCMLCVPTCMHPCTHVHIYTRVHSHLCLFVRVCVCTIHAV